MNHHRNGPRARRAAALAIVAVCAAAGVSAAAAGDSSGCPGSVAQPYRMGLRALTGPAGADLRVAIESTAAECAVPTELKKIQVKTFDAAGALASTHNVTDGALVQGSKTLDLGAVPRDRRIEVDALVQTGTPARTFVLRGATRTLLRPDLVVRSISAPDRAFVGRPFAATVVVAELNGDIGATASLTLAGVAEPVPVDVPANGTATVEFPSVSLGTRGQIDLAAALSAADPGETDTTNDSSSRPIDVRLPPDLAVRAVTVRGSAGPKQALAGKPATIDVEVAELNGDTGATATLTISAVPGAGKQVDVAAGGTQTVSFPAVTFAAPVPVDVNAAIADASPVDDLEENDTLVATIDVSAHELPISRFVLFPSLLGYGAQFNNHLYAPITKPYLPKPPDVTYADVETKMEALQPQLVRIFYNDNWEENYDGTHAEPERTQNYDSFVRVVELAQEAGAIVDISYQNLGNLSRDDARKRTPDEAMKKFADALEDLVKGHHLTNVHWATVGNEPNSPCMRPVALGGCPDPAQITLEEWEAANRALDRELRARGLRSQISMMAGGFVESAGVRKQSAWLPWAAEHFGDIIDAYAVHVYWQYWDTGRLEYRLRDTYNLTKNLLPPNEQKPVYMMEFGVRGAETCGTEKKFANLYYADANCTEIWRTNIGAFQQLWFAIDSAQLGVAGASKWDAYWAVYDRNSVNQQLYWMTGPPWEGYPLTPTYNAMSLLYHVTEPGWQIIRVEPWDDDDWRVPDGTWDLRNGNVSSDQPEQELVAYAGPNGELTVLGLDTHARDLNTADTGAPVPYSIGGLEPNAAYQLTLWNATGDGTTADAVTKTASAAGVVRFEVPLQAAFALTRWTTGG